MKLALLILRDGIWKGLKTTVMLLKIMVPIYLVVVLIKYSPIMDWLSKAFEPVMGIFNLPSEASLPIIMGTFTDEYGVIAAINSFDFTSAAVTTIAMVSLMFHSIPVESALAQKIGYPAGKIILLRGIMAVVTGILVGWLGGVL